MLIRYVHMQRVCRMHLLLYELTIDIPLTLCGHIKTAEQRTIVQQYGDWYTSRLWVACYIRYSEKRRGRAAVPPSPLLAVPNVIAHYQRPV